MTIVVGVAPADTGLSAVTEAARQARWRATPVVVVTVVDPAAFLDPAHADDLDLGVVTEHLSTRGVRNSVRQIIDNSPAADVILALARDFGAALIVLGLHRRSWVAGSSLGTTTRSIVLAAPCPVLIVPEVEA